MAEAEPINWEENGKAFGIEVEHKFYPWARAQLLVEKGEIDGMMTTPNERRWEYCVFGKEIVVPNYWNVFVAKDNPEMIEKAKKFKKLEDLKPYKLIDFIGNGWSESFMKDGYNIHRVPRLEQLPLMLTKKIADLIINSSNWVNWWAEKKGLKDELVEIDVEDIFFSRFHFTFMISRKSKWFDKGLVKAMDIELKKIKESGKWKEILRKYKEPHGFGKPFKTQLNTEKFYMDYDKYPIYEKIE